MTQQFFRSDRPPIRFSICCLLLLFLSGTEGRAQDYWPDSLKKALAHATEWRDKAHFATNLALFYFGQNRPLSDEYGRQAVESAEMSRDRMLMIETYIDNGRRFEQGVGLKGNLEMAMDYFRRAEKIAKDEKLDKGLVYTDVAFAEAYRTLGDNAQAMTYSNQAVTTAGDLDDDSVQVAAYTALGEAYQARNEQLLAFRNFLKALDVAERGKDDWLTRNASAYLAYFYYGIHDEDKAIDYEVNSIIPIDRKLKHLYELRADYNTLAQFFSRKGEYDIATNSYEHAIRLADSIHFNLVKIDSYFGIFNNYFKSGQYQKGMGYFEQHPVVSDYLRQAGMQYVIDGIYADAYTIMGRYDSAAFYFDREGPQVEAKANAPAKADFYDEIGEFYKKRQIWVKAIGYFEKEEAIGKAMGDLHVLEHADKNLDTLYRQANDFAKAYVYHTQQVQYSDSLRELSKATELLKLEVDNDTRRRDRLAKEEEQAREHRHNVQYMGFTVGLVTLFIALVMMGWLAVPTLSSRKKFKKVLVKN
jgi:tetratricopeptide (TPR) repeat protein